MVANWIWEVCMLPDIAHVFDFKLGRLSAPPAKRSVVLIVSPLVSLMIDQICDLRSRGVHAAILSGNRNVGPNFTVTETDIQHGKFNLLYSSPECIVDTDRWHRMLLASPLSEQVVAVVVDEVYCTIILSCMHFVGRVR